MFRFALRITGSAQEAEDVVQDVLEKVWKLSSEQSARVNNWEAWCMTLTRNRSLDKSRSQALRRTEDIDTAAAHADASGAPDRQVEQSDLLAMVRKKMNALPEKQRLVLHLRDVEELSYEEIAGVMDISLEQVKVTLHRARKAVREALIKEKIN